MCHYLIVHSIKSLSYSIVLQLSLLKIKYTQSLLFIPYYLHLCKTSCKTTKLSSSDYPLPFHRQKQEGFCFTPNIISHFIEVVLIFTCKLCKPVIYNYCWNILPCPQNLYMSVMSTKDVDCFKKYFIEHFTNNCIYNKYNVLGKYHIHHCYIVY